MPIRTLHTYVLSQLDRSSHPLSSQRLKGSIAYWSAHFMKCIFAITFSIRSKWLTFFKDLFWELSTDHLNKTRFYEIAPSFSNRTWYQILLFNGVFCFKAGKFLQPHGTFEVTWPMNMCRVLLGEKELLECYSHRIQKFHPQILPFQSVKREHVQCSDWITAQLCFQQLGTFLRFSWSPTNFSLWKLCKNRSENKMFILFIVFSLPY